MDFKAGDWINHPSLGIAQVVSDEDPYYRVRTVKPDEEKRLLKRLVGTAGSPPTPDFRFPSARQPKSSPRPSSKASARHLSLDHYIERFHGLFPMGFDDPNFVSEEREYKIAATHRLEELLGRSSMAELLDSGNHLEICRRARQLATTNLIFRQELISLSDALKNPDSQRAFSLSLNDVLYADDSEESRFERHAAMLASMNCGKWTTATYYQFLATSGAVMFFKPMVAKAMADAVDLALLYRPEPNWDTLSRHQEVVHAVDEKLRTKGLAPRDRIDLQSFMYRTWDSTK